MAESCRVNHGKTLGWHPKHSQPQRGLYQPAGGYHGWHGWHGWGKGRDDILLKHGRRFFIREIREIRGQVFLRRFLQHVLPTGFQRVRHFGWLTSTGSVRRQRADGNAFTRCWTGIPPCCRRPKLRVGRRGVRVVRNRCDSLAPLPGRRRGSE